MTDWKENTPECPFACDALDFVYEELADAKKGEFEGHLASCVSCQSEVGAMSASSGAIREWRFAAFEPLATPRIVLPASEEKASVSIAASILSFFARPAFAVPFSVIVICTVFAIYFATTPDNSVEAPQTERAATLPEAPKASTPDIVEPKQERDVAAIEKETQPEVPEPVAVTHASKKVVTHARRVRTVTNEAPAQVASNKTAAENSVPDELMAEVPETRDRSLRLADLFADGEEN